MQSTMRRAEKGEIAWGAWYWARFIRLYPMYWVAHFGVSRVAFRCPPRTGGRSHHPQPARPAVHRYRDELHVSKRGVVVFRHADPVLCDLSPALLDGAACWTMVVSVHWMRCRIFRALRLARALAPKRIVGTRRFRNLSITGICARDVVAMWYTQSPARMESFLLRGAGFVAGLILYPAALQLYHGLYDYIFVDFATGACCMLEIVGIAGLISLFNSPAKLFGLVGLYSYGLYLTHQPYVIWLGLRIREVPIWAFLLICIPTLAVLSAWGMLLEKGTNVLVNKLASLKKPARV